MVGSQTRQQIVEALGLDLVGPSCGHDFSRELLPDPPSRWYLTGFLVPTDAPIEHRVDFGANDEFEEGGDVDGLDDAGPPDRAAAQRSFLPSSMGLSVLVAPEADVLKVEISWGDYLWESDELEPEDRGMTPPEHEDDEQDDDSDESGTAAVAEPEPTHAGRRAWGYRREPREEWVVVQLQELRDGEVSKFPVPQSLGLQVAVTSRQMEGGGTRLPDGTRSVSVFLVNERSPIEDYRYRSYAFQTQLRVHSPVPYVPRPDLRATQQGGQDDWDEAVADLHYRDVFEYAVGHGVSAERDLEDESGCMVRTTWIPEAEVERVAPVRLSEVELVMEALGNLGDPADAAQKLMPLVDQYRSWIDEQEASIGQLEEAQQETARDLIERARYASRRIEAGINALEDSEALEAFRIANRAMAKAARQRFGVMSGREPHEVDPPAWRPFQLAFILLNLQGIVDPTCDDREEVDLLFFPTGGGKTEAYLGLAAVTMVLRRLRHPGIRSSGVSVLMRYTLRLLTLDQLGRAAGLMCALELERESDKVKLGEWPFEIGLWVGSAATPNRMGRQGYTGPGKDNTAYTKTRQFQSNSKRPSPIPIENCPWCNEKFKSECFQLEPNLKKPLDLRVRCKSDHCAFSGDRWLPIVAVDEPIYRRLPAFIIATVDKFAALPWTGETGALFGLVDRYDKDGFYGPCEPGRGQTLGGSLPPPDLIIQDELHLISGPLGTIAGIYETTIDALASRDVSGKMMRPKIVASTATVRRASSQIQALFGRKRVSIFPPAGVDRRHSFFAKTESADESPARLYVGVAAPGRSLKVILLRTALALLSAGQRLYDEHGGKRNKANPADPYMSLLGYFNSLRELGGSRRIIEDEVRTKLEGYGARRRKEPNDTLFADRTIGYEVMELTSRVPTNEVAAVKRRLSLPHHDKERIDVALATNMISVGLDIVRLGLMAVLGQPKTSAEYIQATSRVGRDPNRPGLVVTLLNVHKPRDRSHYERFRSYHQTFYRSVEATSVTPFAPRALDRALAASLVGLCRQMRHEMTPARGATEILTIREALSEFARTFAERAKEHRGMQPTEQEALRDTVLHRCVDLLDSWLVIARSLQETNTTLQYQQWETSGAVNRLLHEFLDPELTNLPMAYRKFRANRSMRDVEPTVELNVKNLNDWMNKP